MHLIRPFAGLRPISSRASDVTAPPYDVLSSAEARLYVAGKPWSFLHISKPEIDLPIATSPYAPEVYAKGAENLRNMLAEGILVRDPQPYYYVYRLIMGEHTQTGIVATASVKDYDSNRIRRHEFTRPDKEDDRVHQIEALNAQTGPVLLAYPHAPEIGTLLTYAASGTPAADVTADDGVRHTLWVVRDRDIINQLTQAFDAMTTLYIADGHHRSAAASRVAAALQAANPRHTGEEDYNYFLTVIFPHHQMKILDYNRVVADLNGMSNDTLLKKISEKFTVSPSAQAINPNEPGEFGLYLPGQWYRLVIDPSLIPAGDPVAHLDVSLLQNHVIAPLLNIGDPRRDKRIDFVGGIRGLAELENRVDSGSMAAAFSLRPTQMEDLMAVADAKEVMPPKSTWFEPKLADGLVSHVLA